MQIRKVVRKRRIGLLGGSFNPPHRGHLHITNQAIKTVRLSEVWWVISPRNPLKRDNTYSYFDRLEACKKVLCGTKIKLCEVEKIMGTSYSSETIKRLKCQFPRIQFVWLMGADNLHSLHRWKNWNSIFMDLPIAIFARPNQQLKAGLSLAAQRYSKSRVHPRNLLRGYTPAWSIQIGPQINISSTKLRSGN